MTFALFLCIAILIAFYHYCSYLVSARLTDQAIAKQQVATNKWLNNLGGDEPEETPATGMHDNNM